jgi:hypothetical protein
MAVHADPGRGRSTLVTLSSVWVRQFCVGVTGRPERVQRLNWGRDQPWIFLVVGDLKFNCSFRNISQTGAEVSSDLSQSEKEPFKQPSPGSSLVSATYFSPLAAIASLDM